MKLVIVESPAKCTTIQRYLGKDYVVKASLGHIRDLSTKGKGGLGVDIENGFIPSYVINSDKIKVVNELKALAKSADEVILATDPDREGEAIAWHLANVLGLDIDTNKRLEFHEITRDSITRAINNPRTIDKNMVSSQETRRILDRIIGFKLSTLLNKKIRSRSAGRVQSATLKLVYDHELEIKNFKAEEYWNILVDALLHNKKFSISLETVDGKKPNITNEKEAQEILDRIPNNLLISEIKKTIKSTEAKEPFTTSTMQQEAFSKLKYNTKKTQFIAQTLYEGLEINKEHVGLITYMRTDSSRLSPIFTNRAFNFIEEKFGKDYVGHVKKTKNGEMSQDAHEAIRPTSNHRDPESVRQYLSTEQYNLYKLIYNRTLQSLMKPKKDEVLSLTLSGNGLTFKLEFVRNVFPGYEIISEEKIKNDKFPEVNEGDILEINHKEKEQKFTKAPEKYSEARIVKLMEEVGIGRPSTYASTIDTLKTRKYVTIEKGILSITDQGMKTSRVLEKYFPEIVNTKYTAQMEGKLDSVQDGSESRKKMLTDFYVPFIKELDKANELIYRDEMEETGEKCPKCGKPLVYKEGKNGKFIGCSDFPNCDYVKKEKKPEPIKTGRVCPLCGKPLVERSDKKGNKFVACSGFPKCKFIEQNQSNEISKEQTAKKCPKCDGVLVKKKGKYGYFLGCSNYPTCNYMEKIKKRH